ncbi:30S ribosome-binding factor RbfA [Paenibacillus contaminans]|uniref:Ribosome-binding factor A n=1 Tax=Paenibacillus contaminans TaxID=450362 RepID=A0A329MRZ7_9BACL|nr:30S ribosome-binding factor RbfA [Paenibacillus contaminans]RAV22751.1 30S ribosome-binding factor RbfA [Paenibacillus contaminans]
MAKVRTGRVGEQIKKELTTILQTEFKDPRVGFLTITGVEATNDLSQAKVYLSVFGTDEQKENTLKALASGTGFIRKELGKRIRLRVVPELIFKFDTSIEYGSRIESLLGKLNEEKPEA